MNTIQIKEKKSDHFSSLYPLGICGSILSLNYDSSFSNKEYTISLGSEVVHSGIFEPTISESINAFPLQNTGATYTITSDGATEQVSTSDYYSKIDLILRHFSATIKATYPAGSNITCSNSIITLSGNTSGYYEFIVPERGTWTITCTNGTYTDSDQINITTREQIEEIDLEYTYPVFNDNSWKRIHKVSLSGAAASWWSVGDRKAVTLNGTCMSKTFSNNTYYCYILGINHNTSIEGANKIHLQFGATALTGGTYIAFVDNNYNTYTQSGSDFAMNSNISSVGGYNSSRMNYAVCPSFKSVLPSDLQAVIQPVTKWQNNGASASGQSSSNEIWLLSEMEIHGSAEQSQYSGNQQRYDFYKGVSAGSSSKNSWEAASTVKYKDNSTSTSCSWWTRSANKDDGPFCLTNRSGSSRVALSWYSLGFAPGFCV